MQFVSINQNNQISIPKLTWQIRPVATRRDFDLSTVNMKVIRIFNLNTRLTRRLTVNYVAYFIVACVIFSIFRLNHHLKLDGRILQSRVNGSKIINYITASEIARVKRNDILDCNYTERSNLENKAFHGDKIHTLYISDKVYWSEYAEQSVPLGKIKYIQ